MCSTVSFSMVAASSTQLVRVPSDQWHAHRKAEQLAGAGQRHQLLLVQIDRQGAHVGAILHGRLDSCWEVGPVELLTVRTAHLFHLVFVHQQPQLRQVMDLATLLDLPWHPMPRLLTVGAPPWTMQQHLIGAGSLHQRASGMTCLPSCLLATRFALAARPACWSITGRRFAPVMTLFCQTPFHLVQVVCELGDLLMRLRSLRSQPRVFLL
jgi:hypothetical protein